MSCETGTPSNGGAETDDEDADCFTLEWEDLECSTCEAEENDPWQICGCKEGKPQ